MKLNLVSCGMAWVIFTALLTACASGNDIPSDSPKPKTTTVTDPTPILDPPTPPVLPPPDTTVVAPTLNPRAVDVSAHPIYRFYNNLSQDHLLGISATEGTVAGYTYEGIGFYLFNQPSTTRVEIRRCRTAGNEHFLSGDPNCEGMINEGIIGYAEVSPSNAAQNSIYRCFGASHLETLVRAECMNAGMIIEGVLGYAP